MKQISNWTNRERNQKMTELQKIANYNKQYFFSNNFFNKILSELKTNISTALIDFDSSRTCNNWISRWDYLLSHRSIRDVLAVNNEWGPTTTQIEIVYKDAKNISNNHHLVQL